MIFLGPFDYSQSHWSEDSLRLSACLPPAKATQWRESGPFLPTCQALPCFLNFHGFTLLLRKCFPIGKAENQPGGRPISIPFPGQSVCAARGLELVYLSLSQRDFVYRPFCYVPPERRKLPLSNCWRRHKPGKFDLSMQFESGNACINNRGSWMRQVCAL